MPPPNGTSVVHSDSFTHPSQPADSQRANVTATTSGRTSGYHSPSLVFSFIPSCQLLDNTFPTCFLTAASFDEAFAAAQYRTSIAIPCPIGRRQTYCQLTRSSFTPLSSRLCTVIDLSHRS